MSKTTQLFDDARREILTDMRERRDMLSNAISRLEEDLAHPLPPTNIDFKEIQLIAEYDIVQFDLWEQERDRREVLRDCG